MKPVVHFIKDNLVRYVGAITYVVPLNHPSPLVSNTCEVQTSRITSVDANGGFITENTIYVPVIPAEHGASDGS